MTTTREKKKKPHQAVKYKLCAVNQKANYFA